jgi:hypothetical protein
MLTKDFNTTIETKLTFIDPMQVVAVRELPDGGKWTYEIKFDGYRCLAAKRTTVLFFGPVAVMDLLPGFQRSLGHARNCLPIRSSTVK